MAFRCYLAGSMAGRRQEEVKAEREAAVKAFSKIKVFAVDPAAAEQKFFESQKSKKIGFKYSEKVMRAFVNQDKYLIRRCDALLVMTGDNPSDGTWREMCYAEQIGIPVIMIAPRRKRREMIGWSTILVPFIVKDLKEAVSLIKRKWVAEYEEHRKYFDSAIKNATDVINHISKNKSKKYVLKTKKTKVK